MAEHRVPVRLVFDCDFRAPMRRAADAAHALHVEWTLSEATWEPHDWREW